MILGIDPGMTGALALISGEQVVRIWDMPTSERIGGKGKMVNAYLLNDVLCEAVEMAMLTGNKLQAVLEQVGAMPGQGVSSMFSFGRSLGVLEGALAGHKIPVDYVTPQRWKKLAGIIGRDKDASRTKALQLYPDASGHLSRKKDVGRADAILIAHWRAVA